MRRWPVAALVVTCVFAAGAVAPPASAAPGDPAPGWPARRYAIPHDVAISGSGRVFGVGRPETEVVNYSFLEQGVEDDWVAIDVPPRTYSSVVAGPGEYAMAVMGNTSRVFDGTSWGEPVQIAEEIWQSKLVGNANGDAALLWNAASGTPYLSHLARGGTWVTSRVTAAPVGAPRDVAINDAGKVTVVWAVQQGEKSEIRRSTIRLGSTTWSTALRIGIVNDSRPNVTIVTDGQGRETLITGNKLWRQESSNRLPTFQFRTSVRAKLATGDTSTRLIWAVKTDGRYEIHTRFADPDWRAESVLWSHLTPSDPTCDQGIEFGVDMVPGGRAYVAVGIKHNFDYFTPWCEDVEIADFLTVSRLDSVLNQKDLGYYANGGPLLVEAGAAGPVVLEYELGYYERTWYGRFFTR